MSETLPQASLEVYSIKSELEVAFRNYVALDLGNESLLTPEYCTEDVVNPEWLDWKIESSLDEDLRPIRTPGRLEFNSEEKQWVAVESESPVGRLEDLQTRAKSLLGVELNDNQKKKEESSPLAHFT